MVAYSAQHSWSPCDTTYVQLLSCYSTLGIENLQFTVLGHALGNRRGHSHSDVLQCMTVLLSCQGSLTASVTVV